MGSSKLRLWSIGVFFAIISMQSAWASESASEQDFLQDFPIVLSASRLNQPISETPNAITVIDRKMIRASGARNIVELFRLVPGMYVGYDNGHAPVVSYRGATDGYARRMQVLIDGRTVYLQPFGQVSWAELPLDIGDIERIEVVRGPAAASHGSNSVQGVINILTRPASAVAKPQLSFNRGGGGVSDVSARVGSTSERWDYRVTAASRSDDGFDVHSIDAMNDDSTTRLLNIRTAYRPNESDTIEFQAGYSDSTELEGKSNILPGDIRTPREAKTLSNFEQISWLHTSHESSDVKLSYYHIGQITKDNRFTAPDPLPAGTQTWIADEMFVHRHELELQHTLITSLTNRVVLGAGMRYDSVDSPINLKTPVTWKEYRIFAHDEWRFWTNSLLNVGAMAERNALGVTRVSPRIAYNHHLSPRHTLRASLSRAYRNPEMIEEVGFRRFTLPTGAYQEYLAVGGASPERALSREIGYIGQLDEAGSTLEVRAYHDQIDNIIWLDPVLDLTSPANPTPYSFKNVLSATYTGLEATLNFKLGEHSNLTANYAHQRVKAVPVGTLTLLPPSVHSFFADKYSNTVPLDSASLLLDQDISHGMRLGVGYYYQDKVNVLDRTTGQPIMRRLDLKVAKRFGSPNDMDSNTRSGEVALVVQNALDDNNYTDYNPAAAAVRRAYLTATFQF